MFAAIKALRIIYFVSWIVITCGFAFGFFSFRILNTLLTRPLSLTYHMLASIRNDWPLIFIDPVEVMRRASCTPASVVTFWAPTTLKVSFWSIWSPPFRLRVPEFFHVVPGASLAGISML